MAVECRKIENSQIVKRTMEMMLKNRILLLVAVLGCLSLLLACSNSNEPTSVQYKITGTASEVAVTLSNPTGGVEQYNVGVPHTFSYSSFPGWYLYISAQNQDDHGSVTVEIYVNGKLYKTSTSSGAYVIATASGSK